MYELADVDLRLEAVYERAHAFVLVSLSEGMLKVVIEAVAPGTPIVATTSAASGPRSTTAAHGAAVSVPPDDLTRSSPP